MWFEPGDFPDQHRFFDYVESEELFYCAKESGCEEYQLLRSDKPEGKCIIAPGSLIWETDYKNLLLYRDKKGSPTVPLKSIIAKYIIKLI